MMAPIRAEMPLAFLLLCVIVASIASSSPKILLTIPRELTPGTLETFCVLAQNVPTAGLNVVVKLTESPAPKKVYAEHALVMSGDGRTCAALNIPADSSDSKLYVHVRAATRGGDGYYAKHVFEEIRFIEVKPTATRATFVETDMPVYKPGALVRVRLMTIDADLKPVVGDVEAVWIENPGGVRMEQWTNVSRNVGFASVEMKLSEEPSKGMWKIKALVDGKKVEKAFQVKKFVLPKFKVTVTTPKFLLLLDEAIVGRVCARYTYGERVRGSVTLRVWSSNIERSSEPMEARGNLGTDGCFNYSLPLNRKTIGRYKFLAQITEKGTDVRLNGTAKVKVTRLPISLSIKELKNGYKPFIPGQTVRIEAKTTAGDPAVGESIRVIVSRPMSRLPNADDEDFMEGGSGGIFVNVPNGKRKKELALSSRVFVTDSRGMVEFELTSQMNSQKNLGFYAEALTFGGGKKLSEVPQQKIGNGHHSYRRSYVLAARDWATLRSWFSPSESYLKIGYSSNGSALPCGRRINLPISFTYNQDPGYGLKLFYSAISKGKIVRQGFKVVSDGVTAHKIVEDEGTPAANVSSWTTSLSLAIDADLAPAFKLLVYYVRNDGEIVADEASMKTSECLANGVTIRFDAPRKLPGESTTMKLAAAPKSLCGFSVVDKSVSLMGTGNTLKKADIFEWLKEGEIRDKHFGWENTKYCRRMNEPRKGRPRFSGNSEHHDSITAFRDAGVMTITDMTLETRPCKKELRREYYENVLQGFADDEDFMEGGSGDIFQGFADDEDFVEGASSGAMDFMGGGMDSEPTDSVKAANARPGRMDSEPLDSESMAPAPAKKEKIQEAEIRNFFPETWLWDLHSIPKSGERVFEKNVPHTITEWQARAVCSNIDAGLGISEVESLVVFQPFFASAALPYSVIRGEKVPLKIRVFNYLEECIAIELKLIKYRRTMKVVGNAEKTLCLCAQNSKTETFVVIPAEIGKLNVTVSAESLRDGSGICSANDVLSESAKGIKDVVIKPLIVEPEGIERESTYGRFVCLDPKGNETIFVDRVRLAFDAANYVEKSARLRVTAIADVLGPALDGLDDLVKLPTGCGEQNMVRFAPNIFVMEYLEATNQKNEEMKKKAIDFMKTGYKRELTYRHDDGSYSAFGNSDDSGSLWLTAFVVKCFGQARRFIAIDQRDLDASISWLKKSQKPSGEFPTIGRVLHKAMKGGLEKGSKIAPGIGLTAYTLGALLDGGLPPTDESIRLGLVFILAADATTLDSYSLVLVANTLIRVDLNHPRLDGILEVLDSRKKGESGIRFWSDNSGADAATVTSTDIEITAYALMAHAKLLKIDESIEMTKWLTRQRNAKGGFQSTQDTVVGLQGLAKISDMLYAKTGKLRVKFESAAETNEFYLNEGNRLLLHRANVKFAEEDPAKRALNVRVTADTAGCAMIQASLKYNVNKPNEADEDKGKKSFRVKHVVTLALNKKERCKWRKLETCVTYDGKGSSGMVMAEIKMVSGWIPDKGSLKEMTKSNEEIKRFDVDSRMISFYLDDLEPKQRFCFAYYVERQIQIEEAKPGLVKVYDYYEPEIVVDKKYEISQTCDESHNRDELRLTRQDDTTRQMALSTSGRFSYHTYHLHIKLLFIYLFIY